MSDVDSAELMAWRLRTLKEGMEAWIRDATAKWEGGERDRHKAWERQFLERNGRQNMSDEPNVTPHTITEKIKAVELKPGVDPTHRDNVLANLFGGYYGEDKLHELVRDVEELGEDFAHVVHDLRRLISHEYDRAVRDAAQRKTDEPQPEQQPPAPAPVPNGDATGVADPGPPAAADADERPTDAPTLSST